MNKSILVIDTPENCYNCGIRNGYTCGGRVVSLGMFGRPIPTDLHKPEWCPLIPALDYMRKKETRGRCTREVLFRGKRSDGHGWAEGDLSRCIIIGKTHICRIEENLSVTIYEVESSTVCRYTGKEDEEGKKAYENDVIICAGGGKHFQTQIEWDSEMGGFRFRDAENHTCPLGALNPGGDYKWRVIGNIYDNPELRRR